MDTLEIINRHSVKVGCVDALVFIPPAPKSLVINFTGMNPGKFDRWSWYYEDFVNGGTTAYICLRDEEHLFYLNRDHCLNYTTEIEAYLNRIITENSIPLNRVITVGSSMGGYAAIFYAVLLKARAAITSNPLIHRDATLLHKYTLWTRKIDEVGAHWVNLEKHVAHSNCYIHISHGRYPADELAVRDFTMELDRNKISFAKIRTDAVEHVDTICRDNLFAIINMVPTL